MTIAIGFKCTDGAILCADSQFTIYSTKYPGNKIFGFPELKSQPFFAFAGDVTFSTMCIDRIMKKIAEAEKGDHDVASTLTRECRDIHEQYCHAFRDEGLYLQLLVVFRQLNTKLAMYKVLGPSVAPFLSSGVECIGVGTPLALSVIVPLYLPSTTTSQAARIGFYALCQVKKFVEGCGGQTEMVTFREDKAVRGYIPHSEESGKLFEQTLSSFQEAARPILLSYDNIEEETLSFKRRLKSFSQALIETRTEQIKQWRKPARKKKR